MPENKGHRKTSLPCGFRFKKEKNCKFFYDKYYIQKGGDDTPVMHLQMITWGWGDNKRTEKNLQSSISSFFTCVWSREPEEPILRDQTVGKPEQNWPTKVVPGPLFLTNAILLCSLTTHICKLISAPACLTHTIHLRLSKNEAEKVDPMPSLPHLPFGA